MKIELIRIFCASPSDVEAERADLKYAIDKFNTSLGTTFKARCEFIGWEEHTYSAAGSDPQKIINNQIDDQYDIFMGILWSKLGTPTPRSDSGTQEEFERAISRFRNDPNSVNIGVYLKEDDVPRSMIDGKQIEKLDAFITEIQSKSDVRVLTKNFKSDEFRELIYIEIIRNVSEILSKKKIKNSGDDSSKHVDLTPKSIKSDELKTSLKGDTQEDLMLLDYRELHDEKMAALTDNLQTLTLGLNDLGSKMAVKTEEMKARQEKGEISAKEAKSMINSFADDMAIFNTCLLYTSPSPRDRQKSRMPSSA